MLAPRAERVRTASAPRLDADEHGDKGHSLQPGSDGDVHVKGDADLHSAAHAIGDGDPPGYVDRDIDSHQDAQRDVDADADGHGDGKRDSDVHGVLHGHRK